MKKIYRRKFAWGRLAVKADWSQSGDYLYYETDNGIWSSTPFSVASVTHTPKQAIQKINLWLKKQGG
jgi:hypothetical protein